MGCCSFFRAHIHQFATKAHSLYMLTRDDVPFQWGEAEQQACDSLKHSLVTAPILRFPDFSREFEIWSDSSGFGVSTVLMQRLPPLIPGSNGSKKEKGTEASPPEKETKIEAVIAYTSKHLTDFQSKWSTTEKECYAIIHTVKTFFHYLYNTSFVIWTDHQALRYLMTKKDPTGRLHR